MKTRTEIINLFTDSQIKPHDDFDLRCLEKIERLESALEVIGNIFKFKDLPENTIPCNSEINELVYLIGTAVNFELRVSESDLASLRH